MKKTILSLSLLSVLLGGCSVGTLSGSPESTATAVAADGSVDIDQAYAAYEEALQTYVDEQGFVDYVGLQANRQKLDVFNNAIAEIDDETYNSWTEEDQIAFWINAYNSITLASIINQEPLKDSIKDILGVWRITRHPVQKQDLRLDDIEHNILRVDFDEPRLHAAIVCAAVSCPPLRSEPFVGESLDAQLEEQVVQFLAKSDGFRIDREANVVHLSKIFDWFGQDWIPSYGVDEGFAGSEAERAVLNFISNYVSEEDRAYLTEGNYDVNYMHYDWALNVQS